MCSDSLTLHDCSVAKSIFKRVYQTVWDYLICVLMIVLLVSRPASRRSLRSILNNHFLILKVLRLQQLVLLARLYLDVIRRDIICGLDHVFHPAALIWIRSYVKVRYFARVIIHFTNFTQPLFLAHLESLVGGRISCCVRRMTSCPNSRRTYQTRSFVVRIIQMSIIVELKTWLARIVRRNT